MGKDKGKEIPANKPNILSTYDPMSRYKNNNEGIGGETTNASDKTTNKTQIDAAIKRREDIERALEEAHITGQTAHHKEFGTNHIKAERDTKIEYLTQALREAEANIEALRKAQMATGIDPKIKKTLKVVGIVLIIWIAWQLLKQLA